jgi:predicted nucleic acid-binding protein
MGLVIDTDVLVLADRRKAGLDLARYSEYGDAFISTITASELLVGVTVIDYTAPSPAESSR